MPESYGLLPRWTASRRDATHRGCPRHARHRHLIVKRVAALYRDKPDRRSIIAVRIGGDGRLILENFTSSTGVLYPVVVVLIAIAAELGHLIGWRTRPRDPGHADLGTLTGATLGLLALLLAFGFSIALSRYEARRTMVLEEANAIGIPRVSR